MSADPIPLPIWPPDPSRERLALIREAKMGLDTPIRVIPVPAVPGSPGRVLAFGEPPRFFGTSAVIHPDNVDKVESVRAALNHLLHAPEGAPGFFTGIQWMEAFGLKYVGEERFGEPEPERPVSLRFY